MSYVIDKRFYILLQRFEIAQETLNERESEFIPNSVEVLYHRFEIIDIRRAESYIISPDWIASKKATIHPKNEKDNECFKWWIISGSNYNKVDEKHLKKIDKLKRIATDILSYQSTKETGKNLIKIIL